jgi:hypothetical protein
VTHPDDRGLRSSSTLISSFQCRAFAHHLNGGGLAERMDASSWSRSLSGDGEAAAMAQTDQAWDWGVELRDEERLELETLRGTVAQLRRQLDQAHDSLRISRQREREASQALRQLAEARPWHRRRVRTALRDRQLL